MVVNRAEEWEGSLSCNGEQLQLLKYNTKPTTFCITAVLKSSYGFQLKRSFIKYSIVKQNFVLSVNMFELKTAPDESTLMKITQSTSMTSDITYKRWEKKPDTSLVYYFLKAQTQQSNRRKPRPRCLQGPGGAPFPRGTGGRGPGVVRLLSFSRRGGSSLFFFQCQHRAARRRRPAGHGCVTNTRESRRAHLSGQGIRWREHLRHGNPRRHPPPPPLRVPPPAVTRGRMNIHSCFRPRHF